MYQARSEHEEALARNRDLKRDQMVRRLEKRRAKKLALIQLEQDLEFQIAKKPARVSHVHVDGIFNTKDHLVEGIISQILQASNFEEVMMLTKTAHGRMKKLGCFAKVDATIDTDDNGDFEIYFDVEEMPWTYVHGTTETGDNEALLFLRGGVPNITG